MFIVVDCGCVCVIGFICEYLYIDGLPCTWCQMYTACMCKRESYHWINSFIYYLGYYSNTLIFYVNETQHVLNHQVWPVRLDLRWFKTCQTWLMEMKFQLLYCSVPHICEWYYVEHAEHQGFFGVIYSACLWSVWLLINCWGEGSSLITYPNCIYMLVFFMF